MNQIQNLTKGFLKDNPTFGLFLGLCPTLGTTGSALNGMSMGLATTFVLIMSNVAISMVAGVIPDKVRIPSYIVIIAAFVTVVDLLMSAYTNTPGPNGEASLYDTLGIFIPLIVVNCIVLGRAEAFANKNPVWSSFIDALGIGIGFTFSLTLLGTIRELLGNGSFFGHKFIPGDGILIFVLAPGAFLALGYLIMIMVKLRKRIYKS